MSPALIGVCFAIAGLVALKLSKHISSDLVLMAACFLLADAMFFVFVATPMYYLF